MKALFVLTIFFSTTVNANFFEKKPKEVLTFKQIFSGILRAKKSDLPQNYSSKSTMINEFGYDRIYSVQNENCFYDDIFLAKAINVEVDGAREDWVVFSCETDDDAVSFTRYGDNLDDLNNRDMIDLNLSQSLNFEELSLFAMEVDSVKLKLIFEQSNHFQQIMTLEREIFGFTMYIEIIKSTYTEGEVRWEHNFILNMTAGDRRANFLTISKPVSSDGSIYTHYRYFNNKEVEAISYLKHFENLSKIISLIGRKDPSQIFPFIFSLPND